MARINYGIKVKIKELEQANGEITKEFIEEYFENREEDIASNYEMEKNERTKQKTIESIEKKQLEEGNNTVNENKVVSWIKNTATNIRDSFKNAATSIRNSFGKLLSKSDHSRLDSKETKLLEEPKKSLPNDKKEENRNFVPTCTVDINKAREETKKQKEEMNVSKEDTAEKTY